jgi:hypothetical protein
MSKVGKLNCRHSVPAEIFSASATLTESDNRVLFGIISGKRAEKQNHPKVRSPIPWVYGGFYTKKLESSKSYTRKIYVGNIGAYPHQTSIIVLQ